MSNINLSVINSTAIYIGLLLISLGGSCFATDSTSVSPVPVVPASCVYSYASTNIYGPWSTGFNNNTNMTLGSSIYPNLCIGRTYYATIQAYISGANASWGDFPYYFFCNNQNCGGSRCGGTFSIITTNDVVATAPLSSTIGTWSSYRNTSLLISVKFTPTVANEAFPAPYYRNATNGGPGAGDCVTIAYYSISFS